MIVNTCFMNKWKFADTKCFNNSTFKIPPGKDKQTEGVDLE